MYKRQKIKLGKGKEIEITHSVESSFFNADGQPITVQEFLENLYGSIPEFFKSEAELIRIWSCLLYTSDAADERSSVDLGGRRIIKKKKT